MGKLIKHIKIAAFVIIALEIALIITFMSLYFTNAFNLRTLIDPNYLIGGACVLVFLNLIFMWVVVLRVSSLKQHTDLKAAEIIGGDVQEAYNFGMIGLVITDDNDMVLWTNDLFRNRHIDIIDSNILFWQPDLAILKESSNVNTTVKIEVFSRQYEVKYLNEAGLWIFKDTSELEANIKYNREQAPVIGILNIDNYEEIIHGEDDFNDTITKVKNVIFNYSKEHGLLLRRLKDGTYSLLCNYKSFCSMNDDKFSILDKVRENTQSELSPVTISLGLAHNFPDVVKLNEMANNALDIAMSRGGDQVVVSVYGSDMKFIGGKSEAQEKRHKVQIRVYADSLVQLIKNSKNVLVMGHTDLDMDALGACLGIKAISTRFEKECRIVCDIKSTETKTRAALNSSFSKNELEEMIISSKDAINHVSLDTLLVVVDVHIPRMVMAPELLERANKIVVIDHHRRAEEFIDSPVFNHIDPAASSTSEIITEFIKFSTVNPMVSLPPIYATIMLSGIFLDSSFYRSKNTGIRTFEASTILKEFGADNSLADDFLKDDFEEIALINQIIQNIKTPSYGVVYAIADQNMIYERSTLAKAANQCLMMKNVNAAFIFGKVDNSTIRMSARSNGTINVQLLAEKLGGGGHFTSAAAAFSKESLEDVERMLNDILREFLAEAKRDKFDTSRIEEEA